jgi:hypothetical protein
MRQDELVHRVVARVRFEQAVANLGKRRVRRVGLLSLRLMCLGSQQLGLRWLGLRCVGSACHGSPANVPNLN